MSADTCVVCYEIKEGWHCHQCRDGAMCFECLEKMTSETCPVCRTGMNKNTCIVDSSHGVATRFCEKCKVDLCVECDVETHMYALMRFHVRTQH